MTVFIVRILFLLLPGAIGAAIYWKLRGRKTQKDWEDFFLIVIFSLLSYLLFATLSTFFALFNSYWACFGLQTKTFSYFQPFFDENIPLDLYEVFWSCIAAVPLSVLASYVDSYKLINRIGRNIKSTSRFGDEDVWEFVNRSPDFKDQWVTVRDKKLNLNYSCWIEAFSDSGKERELVLRDVRVFDDATSEELYCVNILYLSRASDEILLESSTYRKPEDILEDTSDTPQGSQPLGEELL